jgi:hypothetical protein
MPVERKADEPTAVSRIEKGFDEQNPRQVWLK